MIRINFDHHNSNIAIFRALPSYRAELLFHTFEIVKKHWNLLIVFFFLKKTPKINEFFFLGFLQNSASEKIFFAEFDRPKIFFFAEFLKKILKIFKIKVRDVFFFLRFFSKILKISFCRFLAALTTRIFSIFAEF